MSNIWTKKIIKTLSLALICFILCSLPIFAQNTSIKQPSPFKSHVYSGRNIKIDASETIKGPIFIRGRYINVDGIVDGTTFIAGQEVTINGTIKGDVIILSEYINIKGTVEGDLYSAASKVIISGKINGSSTVAAQDIDILQGAVINRDGLFASSRLNVLGKINRQLFAGAESIIIDGQVNDDTKLTVGELKVDDTANIAGSLTYKSKEEAYVSSNAKISGPTKWIERKFEPKPEAEADKYADDFFDFLIKIASALLIWFIVITWKPFFWKESQQTVLEKPLKTLGLGVLILILGPIATLVLMITIIGIPLGVILALMYGVALYLSKIVVAVLIGYYIAEKFNWPELHKGVWIVLLGLTLLTLVTKIPIVGVIIYLIILFTGLGAIAITLFQNKPTLPIPPVEE